MKTALAIFILIVILVLAIGCIIREKKKGVKCIGCPAAGSCTKHGGAKKLEKEIRKHIEEEKHSCQNK